MHTLLYAALPLFVGMVAVVAQGASANVPADVLKDLAPGGKLRAALNLGNSVLVQTDAAPGQPQGVTPDLARELGWRLGFEWFGRGRPFIRLRTGNPMQHSMNHSILTDSTSSHSSTPMPAITASRSARPSPQPAFRDEAGA